MRSLQAEVLVGSSQAVAGKQQRRSAPKPYIQSDPQEPQWTLTFKYNKLTNFMRAVDGY